MSSEFSTTLTSAVPECELQAIAFSLYESSWYTYDLLTLIRTHIEDGGAIDEITPSSIVHLTETAQRALNKQQSLIDIFCTHIDIGSSICDRTFIDIHDEWGEDPDKPVSREYQDMLMKAQEKDSDRNVMIGGVEAIHSKLSDEGKQLLDEKIAAAASKASDREKFLEAYNRADDKTQDAVKLMLFPALDSEDEVDSESIEKLRANLTEIATQANVLRSLCDEIARDTKLSKRLWCVSDLKENWICS